MDALMRQFYEVCQYLASNTVFVREEDLNRGPSSWGIMRNVDIQVVHVNPDTNEIDDCQSKNTKVSVEEAIIRLAELVKKKYDE